MNRSFSSDLWIPSRRLARWLHWLPTAGRAHSTAKTFMRLLGVVFLMVGLLWPLVNLLFHFGKGPKVPAPAAAVAIVQEAVTLAVSGSPVRAGEVCEHALMGVMNHRTPSHSGGQTGKVN